MYLDVLEEGIDEKIPKLLGLLPNKVRMDEKIHDLSDTQSKGSFIRYVATQFDPSPNAAYITWILKMVKLGQLRGVEDRQKYRDVLETFTKLKLKPQFPGQYKDINRFKSFGDLAEVVEQYADVKSKKEEVRIATEEGITLMEEMGKYKLYVVTKSEAAAKHFRNTQWCVKDPRHFDNYGPPYYFFTKNEQPYTLLHLGSNQCMDTNDRDMQLDKTQKYMMETEEMTQYVVDNDNSADALSNYSERVGEGYDNVIAEYVDKQLTELIDQYDFKHYYLNTDNISDGYYSAGGFITYNFKGFENYFDDKKFQDIVKDALSRIDKYPDYLDSDHFSEDGVSINIEYDSQSDYYSKGKIDQLKSFLNELQGYDDNYENDVENFEERLTEKLLDSGYITSNWGSFKTKVLDNINENTFKHAFARPYRNTRMSKNDNMWGIKFDFSFGYSIDAHYKSMVGLYGDIPIKRFTEPSLKHEQTPYHDLLRKFFKHLTDSVKQISVNITDDNTIIVYYDPQFDEDMSLKDYMKDFKIFKSLDIHHKEYQNQIDKFGGFLRDDHRTGKEEIPLFTLRSRKSPKEQGYFQFREGRIKKFSELYDRILKS